MSQTVRRGPAQGSSLERAKHVLLQAAWGQEHFWGIAALCLVVDALLTGIIVIAVPYTEIDFSTYMQQVQLYQKGERTYSKLTGDTGPCVYPALHVYLYSALYHVTGHGLNIKTGQWLFAVLYLACQVAAMGAYKAARMPPIMLPLLISSKRLHSIFVLRLFNDCWAVTIFYFGVWAMCHGRWKLGSTLYSLALGVKMNILLYAPAMAAIYYRALGLQASTVEALRVILIQVLIGLPFLRHDAGAYISSAFNLSRIFLYKWTVNLRFLSEEVFLSKRLATALLALHATTVAAWLLYRWTGIGHSGVIWIKTHVAPPSKQRTGTFARLSGRFIVTALYTSNLIGIAYSRSLHYQFYSWYAHQIPLLVYLANLPRLLQLLIPLCIEAAWNTYPSTTQSSLLLSACHITLLYGLWTARQDDSEADESRTKDRVMRAGNGEPKPEL